MILKNPLSKEKSLKLTHSLNSRTLEILRANHLTHARDLSDSLLYYPLGTGLLDFTHKLEVF